MEIGVSEGRCHAAYWNTGNGGGSGKACSKHFGKRGPATKAILEFTAEITVACPQEREAFRTQRDDKWALEAQH
jgi:hypothetical protein